MYHLMKFCDLTLEHINEFTWFGHMWSHQQPHLYQNVSSLQSDMLLNKQFAIVSSWKKKRKEKKKEEKRNSIIAIAAF